MSNDTGIYKITCIKTGKLYIGSTWKLSGRWEQHLNALKRRQRGNVVSPHKNDKLYEDFILFGEEAFKYEVIERCDKEERRDKETEWIKHFNAVDEGYKIARSAAKFAQGVPKPQKWHDKRDTEYHFIDPLGNEVKGKGLMKFCKDNNLKQQAMGELLSDGTDIKQNFGWRKYSPELVGIPFNRDEFTSNRLVTAWNTSRAHQRGLQRKQLKYSDDEVYNMYHATRLSVNQVTKLCELKSNGYIYKLLTIMNSERGGEFRVAGGRHARHERVEL